MDQRRRTDVDEDFRRHGATSVWSTYVRPGIPALLVWVVSAGVGGYYSNLDESRKVEHQLAEKLAAHIAGDAATTTHLGAEIKRLQGELGQLTELCQVRSGQLDRLAAKFELITSRGGFHHHESGGGE